ncbi:mannitol dehydrogenase family protein [Pontibacter sp. E15-1]|uniref:mannitol dehydrogenase family protein n=1 Tax=Pontibacter sp. E15-1 TaxID=2919918 RepID=UPI001F4F1741|nr:mannitol dehydrogenase family protein [Pontibacter sp. E15-1]MCJ8165014.1 mannitol dehydrogenase family protein [Pontibacter sp. E15-1]
MSTLENRTESGSIKPGILHIGVGNFHRAHQAFYTNALLEFEDQANWGICGVSLLPSDKKTVDGLRQQNLAYTVTVCGRDGIDKVYESGAIKELIAGYEDPKAVIAKIAAESIKIITLTITEGGYNLDKQTGDFVLSNEAIQHDLENPGSPKTVFGFVAEGLRARKKLGKGGLTILSCDNLQHNGNTAKKAFTAFIAAQDSELAAWVGQNVTFPNSMVDRITPATTEQDKERLNRNSGINDQAPVYCEDFIQWVIEDNFIAGRPAWERVGVEFTDDVSAFENMKLSLLNASHTLLSYPAFLKGYRAVDQAMQDPDIVTFVRNFMDIDVTPYVQVPEGTDLDEYKQILVERFSNRAVSDQVSRLCFDGISKFPVYIMPNLLHMIRDGKDLTRVAFLIAAYRHYLKYLVDETGQTYQIAEPWLTTEDKQVIASEIPNRFLELSAFKSLDLKSSAEFARLFAKFVKEIKEEGVSRVLQTVLIKTESFQLN